MSPHSTPRTPAKKVGKKPANFPLFKHQKGYWAKKVRGKHVYFESITDDPNGSESLKQWLDDKDYLLAGRIPPRDSQGVTVAYICNHFMTQKDRDLKAGAIKLVTFKDYFRTCEFMVAFLGKDQQFGGANISGVEDCRVDSPCFVVGRATFMTRQRTADGAAAAVVRPRDCCMKAFDAIIASYPQYYQEHASR